ncbi:hypothetical protein D3H55_14710 [Bacillus salacetis]|uniref:DUF4878 domain-containing protein n=1 Tax=Bacillus salacetis TaxID=2315464 RepID=A0A3A1QV64_9BACI|nr:hypothetical protein [Bacillus salacetis]RIW31869.1 hypothetical protein D3H55_14710 [Bacillus salacetis]
MRRRKSPLPLLAFGLVLIFIVFLVLKSCAGGSSPPDSPETVIEKFYEYEQDGDFGNSWELFHSEMKKRFKKSSYIQTKNHVFLGHMGVETFDIEVGKMKKLEEWKMTSDGLVFKDVTEAEVTMKYDSQFGIMEISQTCYAVLEKGEWKVLWDYNF